ncbi:TRAP transporter substrate-binding protein [Pseudemcibacter aquimaris]|uniref:TRAP transporter substrate-binding protein n=1 Tax=Pseudemcibacter aquimaris TaxID=2857064 RepID=UPI002010D86E|nr:twin-arginine translocation signal domain-containing protein [Pseudemcibacter aquimaris]MCC3860584.1 twin-arginine translocation signal domain-containing protein [Pseudemcibacter aquimaris]WDU60233.1 twin-arginine translocation signal domain-containing protein [Pseudemcibacter aquimaris]
MERRSFLKKSASLGAGTLAAGAVAACSPSPVDPNSGTYKNAGASSSTATGGNSRPSIDLKMVTTWPKNFPGLGTRAEEFARDIEIATNGRIRIRVYAADEMVPALQAFDAVSQGNADIYHGPDYYWQGKHIMFNFFGAVPFGLSATEMTQWLQYGGGQELWDELAAGFNVKPMLCNATGMQMGGWFNKEINSVEDFQGLKMRIPGFGGEIITRMGGTPVTLPGGEIFLSLSQGNIDATEWIGPWNDLALGFHQVAEYYYTSAYHEPSASVCAGWNLDVWNELDDSERKVIEALAEMHYARSLAEFNARNANALRQLVNDHGVQLRQFPQEVMKALADVAADIAADMGRTDDLSTRIYNSYMATLSEVKEWNGVADEPYFAARRLSDKFGQAL